MVSGEVLDTKAFPYYKCRNYYMWLGQVARFK